MLQQVTSTADAAVFAKHFFAVYKPQQQQPKGCPVQAALRKEQAASQEPQQ